MNLDSARELKQMLATGVLANATTGLRAIAAQPMDQADQPPRSLALGIAPAGQGFRLAVRVQKRAMEGSRELAAIIKHAKGEVDVRYIGRVVKRAAVNLRARHRPLIIGCSTGHFKITAGTLGCFVKSRAGGGGLAMLSNNHVLANENAAKKGDAILQQGRFDGGQDPADIVAKLTNFIRLKKRGTNFVDCAFAEIDAGITTANNKLAGLGKLKGLGAAILDAGTKVAKLGRTTALTRGQVTAFELDNVIIGYDIGDLRFDDQIEIDSGTTQPFSMGGDSGSLIVDADLRAVALLFAGADQGGSHGQGVTYANPLHSVLDALKLDLAL